MPRSFFSLTQVQNPLFYAYLAAGRKRLLRPARDVDGMLEQTQTLEFSAEFYETRRPVIAMRDAHVDRAERTQRYVRDCILLAVVTSPEVAAELIDRAIECTLTANGL